jgi:hypothetical protein
VPSFPMRGQEGAEPRAGVSAQVSHLQGDEGVVVLVRGMFIPKSIAKKNGGWASVVTNYSYE